MSNAEDSAVKIVGFKVPRESPTSAETVPSTNLSIHAGSPLPVSIPLSFNKTPRKENMDEDFRGRQSREATKVETLDTEADRTSSELTRQMAPGMKNDPTVLPVGIREEAKDVKAEKSEDVKTKTKEKANLEIPSKKAAQSKDAAGKSKKKPDVQPKKKGDVVSPSKKSTQSKEPSGKGPKEKMQRAESRSAPCISLFDHLDQFRPFDREEMMRREDATSLDPVFLQFCIDYAEGALNASGACKAMLESFSHAISFFHNDASLFYTREYLAFLNRHIEFLVSCRSLNTAMRNAIRIIKVDVSKLKSGIPLEEGRDAVRRLLRGFIEERVDVLQIIAKEADTLIKEQDVILTFSASDTVFCILAHAWSQKKRFRVIVVDARPECAGKTFLGKLTEIGIPCTYLFINALGFALKGVSKVMMGASAVLSNGTVVGRAGSALIAMMAHASHIPTVVCCQTLKFHERVQLDSFTHNELGDASAILSEDAQIKDLPFLSLLNLKYDLMPSAFVSVVVGELGFIPASSVPVILREHAVERDISHI